MEREKKAIVVLIVMILGLMFVTQGIVLAEDFAFETAAARYVVSESGMSKSLQEKDSGRELLVGSPMPFATLRKGGKVFPATNVRRIGEFLRVDFGESGISADYRVSAEPECIVIELTRLDGGGVEEIRLMQLRVGGLANAGTLPTVSWDDQFAVSLMGLSDRVDSRFGEGMLLSSVYPEFGMVGEKVALVAVPTRKFMEAVQKIELQFQLPTPRIGGSWAKISPDVRSSYLFTDLTEANADETIRFAKMAGFKYILIYSHIWSSSLGSYPINTSHFPRGEDSLKAVIAKCHAAGLKVGMHMLTSFVSKNDALVKGRPDPRLLSDAQAVLASDINKTTQEIVAVGALAHFPGVGPYGPSKNVRIDNEIIHYEAIGGSGSTTLMQGTRGYAGTTAAIHQAGAKIYHLAEVEGSYLADLKTTLKDEIADRVAGIIDRCGFDMIYFDGGEICINGPCWYWAGQQQMSVWKRVKRDLLVQGSGVTHWTWHIFARGTCDDFAAVAPKQYLDYHKIADYWQFYTKSFMPAELGWWGFLESAPDHPATTPDEVEHYAVRMLALNSAVSIETTLAALKANGRTEEMLRLVGEYEQLRLSEAVPPSVRNKLRSGEWHMVKKDGRPEFQPVRYDAQRADLPGEVAVKNEFGSQKLKFRLQAGPRLAKVGDRSNITLFRPDPPLILSPRAPYVVESGALVGRTDLTKSAQAQAGTFTPVPGAGSETIQGGRPLDLSTHRALAVRLKVDSPLPKPGTPSAVLNVQLESGGRNYRDHYIELDFVGERTVIIPEPTTERMLSEFRPPYENYPFKAAMYGFNYQDVVAVNLRWMRQPLAEPARIRVTLVEALAETDSMLKNPEISIGATKIVLPVTLKAGEYLEFWDEGPSRVFDRNGIQLSTVEMPSLPMLATGNNRIFLSSDGAAPAKLTTILLGEALKF